MIPVKNFPLLMNLVYTAYNRGLDSNDFGPRVIKAVDNSEILVTYCNRAMQFILHGMGYDEMEAMNANEMVDFMEGSSSGWISPADDQVAQSHTNTGVIVLAGWRNPDGHGHVNLVLPGILEKSHSLGRAVPKCLNIGKDVFIGKKISYAYTAKEQFKYYALSGMV